MTSAPTSGKKASAQATKSKSELEYTVVVAVREQNDERQFLMVRHMERGWELPGGKLEGAEGPVHCALREFREETGHILGSPRFVCKMARPNGTCFVFTGGLGDKVQSLHENEVVAAMRWYSRLPPVSQLAFPDDPYEEIGDALGLRFR